MQYMFSNFLFYCLKIIIFKIENRKLNGISCYDLVGECDYSVGLECLGITGAKKCSYDLILEIYYLNIFLSFFYLKKV